MNTQPTPRDSVGRTMIDVLLGLTDNPAENEMFVRGVKDYYAEKHDSPINPDTHSALWRAWQAGHTYAFMFSPPQTKPFDLEGVCTAALARVQNQISRDFRDLALDVAESFDEACLQVMKRHFRYCLAISLIHGSWGGEHWKQMLESDSRFLHRELRARY